MLETLRALVERESPSSDKAAVDLCLDFIAGEAERLGAKTRRHRTAGFGDHLQAEFDFGGSGGARGKRGGVLILGHADTVWDIGTLKRMPFRIAGGRAWGPGTFDMKGGITAALFAIAALRETKTPVAKRVRMLLTSDEEVGSPSSRALLESLARESDAVFVVEPGTGLHGALKTSRKGVGDYLLTVHGRAAHSGVDFGSGVSAINELARQIVTISGFTRLDRGITVNPGVIGGGTRSNVVAEKAWAHIDVRIVRAADENYLKKKFAALKPADRKTRLEITGGVNRPPMERTAGVVSLFNLAKKLGEAMGMDVQESATGGGSDGNFTAALGIPTLDGLGAVGQGAHAIDESIVIEQLPRRSALLAELIASV